MLEACWEVGVGPGGGGADESLAGVGGLGEGARPAEGYIVNDILLRSPR